MDKREKNLSKGEADEEEKLKASARKISVFEASSYSLMDGFGLRYVVPYAVALGAGNFAIGALNSLPGFLGTMSQLLTPRAMEKFSRRKIVFLSVLSQAILWLPLILIGILYFNALVSSKIASLSLVMVYSLLILSGAFGGPAWASWMKSITEGKSIGRYFSKRNMTAGILSLVCMLIAGIILDVTKTTHVMLGFGILLFIAFLGRLGSALLFLKQYEPKFTYDKAYHFSFLDFVKKMHTNNFGRFVMFSGLISFSVAFSSSFFGVFMLKELNFDNTYIAYTLVSMSSVITSLISLPLWGRFTDRYGNVALMKLTAWFIPLIPLLWAGAYFISSSSFLASVVYLTIIEAISGVVWGGFSFASGMFIYLAVSHQRLPICAAYTGIISSTLSLIGAGAGSFALSLNLGVNPYILVFIVSVVLRAGVVYIMMDKFKEVREVEAFDLKGNVKQKFYFLDPGYLLTGIKRAGFSYNSQEP